MINILFSIAFIIIILAVISAAIGVVIMLFDLYLTSNFDEIFFKIAFGLLAIGATYLSIIMLLAVIGVIK